jgi:antitoxin component of MazEF toxin-antitoxin module
MPSFERRLRAWGPNSLACTIPPRILKELALVEGDEVRVVIAKKGSA